MVAVGSSGGSIVVVVIVAVALGRRLEMGIMDPFLARGGGSYAVIGSIDAKDGCVHAGNGDTIGFKTMPEGD